MSILLAVRRRVWQVSAAACSLIVTLAMRGSVWGGGTTFVVTGHTCATANALMFEVASIVLTIERILTVFQALYGQHTARTPYTVPAAAFFLLHKVGGNLTAI